MVKILNGEIVPDNDPRVRASSASSVSNTNSMAAMTNQTYDTEQNTHSAPLSTSSTSSNPHHHTDHTFHNLSAESSALSTSAEPVLGPSSASMPSATQYSLSSNAFSGYANYPGMYANYSFFPPPSSGTLPGYYQLPYSPMPFPPYYAPHALPPSVPQLANTSIALAPAPAPGSTGVQVGPIRNPPPPSKTNATATQHHNTADIAYSAAPTQQPPLAEGSATPLATSLASSSSEATPLSALASSSCASSVACSSSSACSPSVRPLRIRASDPSSYNLFGLPDVFVLETRVRPHVYLFVCFIIWLIGPQALYAVVAAFFIYRWHLKRTEELQRQQQEHVARILEWKQNYQMQLYRQQIHMQAKKKEEQNRNRRRGNIHSLYDQHD